ncbi:hypothetical protein DRQ25_14955 [Candidatus Fermentibacteria bacterium]|nr:MAG: hypothetical protein DRQ25_14955 [Candidatus Fermentibacteria bacterium]
MTISQIGWQRGGSSGAATGNYNSFKLYVGLASASELSSTFADNYITGTRTLVYETASQAMSAGPDEWVNITLDSQFWYNGVDNLIVELEWVGGANMFYTYMWETGVNRGLMNKSDINASTGTLATKMSQLMFDGTLALEPQTFGTIKTLWKF